MHVQVSIVNPLEVTVAITIEMLLRDWKDLHVALRQNVWQRASTHEAVWDLLTHIDDAADRIEKIIHFEPREDA